MRFALSTFFLMFTFFVSAQEEPAKEKPRQSLIKSKEQKEKDLAKKAPITSYRIITLDRDTTFVDTSLTIQKDYKYNYLRRDNFGLLPFYNDGQTYNTLQYSLTKFSPYPEFGYKAKHFSYIEADEIKYYSVATPMTELYFKTVYEEGQNVDAFITLNTSEQFNFSVAYRGIRALGRYINQLSSSGNFRFTTSYHTKDKRYIVNAHFTGQDILNGENGGITRLNDFESKNDDFTERERLEVYLKDAKTFLKGQRYFIDHAFRINPTEGNNNLYIAHQFNFEKKFFEYNQATVPSSVDGVAINRFGNSYIGQNINDQVRYSHLYNKVGAIYENSTLGKFQFFAENYGYNYYYSSVFILDNGIIPAKLKDDILSVGGQYEYQKNNWNAKLLYSNSISDQSLTNIDGNVSYKFDDKNKVSFGYQKMNKLPNHIYNLHQSSYVDYVWKNNFKNEKINKIQIEAQTQWATASAEISSFNDFLYFSDDSTNDSIQLVSPKQYDKSIKYLSLKASKEIRYWKLALDNTVLYQKTDQSENILNVPEFVTRNTLYFSDYFFKKALYLQTGVTFNYFTKFYSNDYNPVTAEFFVQQKKQIGDFANLDFFINARIRQTRIFLKAEHFNSGMSKTNNFLAAPNYPYRDFVIRFGLVWNFFQ